MDLTPGSRYIVNLGALRGSQHIDNDDIAGYLPDEMLADGTVVTIVKRSGGGWYLVEECNSFVYPASLLKPLESKTERMLKILKDL